MLNPAACSLSVLRYLVVLPLFLVRNPQSAIQSIRNPPLAHAL